MRMEDLSKELNMHLSELKHQGGIVTNIFPGCTKLLSCPQIYSASSAIVVCAVERFRKRILFAYVDSEDGRKDFLILMKAITPGCVCEYLQRGSVDNDFKIVQEAVDDCDITDVFLQAGFEIYKKYVRITTTYISNPMLIPETGRRKVLYEMYEPMGEYPNASDAEELYLMNKEIFDRNSDDVFTIDEWKQIIDNKRCLVYKENGKITTYYVWELQGKKLYNNISVNLGPANYLYNMERRIFEEFWEKGIRTYYAWFDTNNKTAINRINPNEKLSIKCRDILYNNIYISKEH